MDASDPDAETVPMCSVMGARSVTTYTAQHL